MKRTSRILSMMITILFCISLFATAVSAASRPSMFPEEYEYNVTQGETAEIKFTVFHEFKNEEAHIRVHKDDGYGSIVASSDRKFSNYSNLMTEYTVTWDTDDIEPGKYVVEYWVSFYTMYEWHEPPTHNNHLLTINVKAAPCKNGHNFDGGKVTKAPTCKATGVNTKSCTVCGTKETSSIPKTEHQWDGGTIKIAASSTTAGNRVYTCKVCKETKTEGIPAKFNDVDSNGYYAPAIDWAFDKGVTSGTTDNTFSPSDECTRGQVLTFLWRAMGSPNPKTSENPFKDVNSNQYYYKAILWGVEQGITGGTSPTTFSPEETCSYAHILTFIWRSQGKPDSTGNGEWYEDALTWSSDNGILEETNAASGIESSCPRKDVVTYLYRILDEEGSKTLQHKFGEWKITKEATCSSEGSKTRTCTECKEKQTKTIPMTEHNLANTDCSKPSKCTKCGAEVDNAKGHTWVDASCSKPKTCSVCGSTDGNALSHSYNNGICSVCNAKNPNYIKQNLVYQDSRVIIKFKELTSKGVVFEVENLTNVNITIQADAISINKKSTDNITMSDDVAPMSIGEVTARCSEFSGMKAGVISGQFRIIDFDKSFDTYDATFSSITIDSDVSIIEPSVPKTLLYSDNKVKIYYHSIDENGVYFAVQNFTDKVITIQADSVSVNKRSTNDITMSDDVAPHSIGVIKARCAPPVTSGITTIGGSLRVIDFNRSFQTYDAKFVNVPIIE